MFLSKKLLSPVCIGLISVSVMTPLTVDAKQVRSQVAKNNFKASHPCPSKGNLRGSCPGYIIDHIIALASDNLISSRRDFLLMPIKHHTN
jgi:hypothetical protein